MKKPLLYEPFDSDGVAHDMRQDNGGNWVHIEDYALLSAKKDELHRRIDAEWKVQDVLQDMLVDNGHSRDAIDDVIEAVYEDG